MTNNIYELDFTGVQSSSFIEEGVHTVKIKEAEFKKAQTGSDQLQLTFEAADGRIRSAWYSLLPQALWKLKGVLETLGIPCEGKIKLNTTQFKGKVCVITVEPDENDSSKLYVTKVSKAEASAPAVAYTTAPAPQMPVMPNPAQVIPNAPIPVAPVVQQAAQPVAPAPVQQAQQPMTGQLPPWMQAAAQPGAAPQGNLPPWMQQK
jgi:hypothetical protein